MDRDVVPKRDGDVDCDVASVVDVVDAAVAALLVVVELPGAVDVVQNVQIAKSRFLPVVENAMVENVQIAMSKVGSRCSK